MPVERAPRDPLPRGYQPAGGVAYRVQDGDTWESLAARHGIRSPHTLIEFNFATRSPAEVNYYLRHHVGCVRPTDDELSWAFSADADPGVIYLPRSRRRAGAGSGDYVVQDEETFTGIAFRQGHSWEKVWNHPGNAGLKQARGEPEGVAAGDRVHLPAIEPKQLPAATERFHRFRRIGHDDDTGTLEVHLDLDEGMVAHSADAFVLEATGGPRPYRLARSLRDDADPRDHGISLVFPGVPRAARLSLTVTLESGVEAVLFRDVPFGELHQQDDALAAPGPDSP